MRRFRCRVFPGRDAYKIYAKQGDSANGPIMRLFSTSLIHILIYAPSNFVVASRKLGQVSKQYMRKNEPSKIPCQQIK